MSKATELLKNLNESRDVEASAVIGTMTDYFFTLRDSFHYDELDRGSKRELNDLIEQMTEWTKS